MKLVNLKAFNNLIKESNNIRKSKSFLTKFQNIYLNYTTAKFLSRTFNDFSEYHFGEQIRIIYEDTRTALIRKEFPILLRSLVNFKVNEANMFNVDEMNAYIKKFDNYFVYPTSKWKIIYLRVSDDKSSAFATFKYYNENNEHYFSMIRDIKETKSFYAWRLLLPSQMQDLEELEQIKAKI